MLFYKMLKFGLLFGAVLLAILTFFFFGRPQFLIGLMLLAALVEISLSQYRHHPEIGDDPIGHD